MVHPPVLSHYKNDGVRIPAKTWMNLHRPDTKTTMWSGAETLEQSQPTSPTLRPLEESEASGGDRDKPTNLLPVQTRLSPRLVVGTQSPHPAESSSVGTGLRAHSRPLPEAREPLGGAERLLRLIIKSKH